MSLHDPQTVRSLRLGILEGAKRYRDEYRQEHFGFQRRMLRRLLDIARDYRREERNPSNREAA